MHANPPSQPAALWHCLHEASKLPEIDHWFVSSFQTSLLDDSGRLRFPKRRLAGRVIYRTSEPGITLVKCVGSTYSVYEDRTRHETRFAETQWAEFLAGEWSVAAPCEAGLYFARSRDGIQSVRRFELLEDGGVQDVSGGFVAVGEVTRWLGEWWSVRVPKLFGAKS